ncbi:MAG: hypothetical protein Q4C74_06550 [Rothia sp. (in: high G+C Gram-positive bacteria)]|nr:hypothetical protein [Rothia sp. (in: high G+C Gram-positive bacteria)]
MSVPSYDPHPEHQNIPHDTQAMSLGSAYGIPANQAPNTNLRTTPAIKTLHIIMWLSVAICILNSAGEILTKDFSGFPFNPQVALLLASIIFFIAAAVILGLCYLVFYLINKGKNSGRITGTVFAALAMMNGLSSGVAELFSSPLYAILQIAWAVLAGVWIILAYQPRVSALLR